MKRDKASSTARKVALNVVSLGAKPGMEEVLPPGIVDATTRLLVESGVVGRRAVRFAGSRWAVAIYEAFDWMMPGQFEAFAHRKAFCEAQVRDGIASGASQVLVLGAGYDTLSWRLAPEFPGVGFHEIDHPATGRRKADGIENMGARDNLSLIREDLGDRRLTDVLTGVDSWDCTAKSVIIAEGLTQYLPPDAVHDLFVQCRTGSGVGSRLVFTYVATGDDGRPDIGRWTGLTLWLLKASGEPWLWSVRPEELSSFLDGTGWEHAPQLMDPSTERGVEHHAVAVQ
jgi:methyltransferase (TIGR00027 family)